jgi:Uma2 family endonuclease
MTTTIASPIYYPSGDGQPVAETFDHLYAILITIEVLRLYLQHEQACILGNQFLYYEEGASNKHCAPDVMVIFGVEPGSRDNYKIWEEGEVPRVAFEMTSPSTKGEDEGFKKNLYAEIGIAEYWQFDPKGQWIKEKLRGFRLVNGIYEPIVNGHSEALGLRLEVAGKLIAFYRLDNGEKLLIPLELYESRQEFQAKARQFQAEARQLQAEARQFQEQLMAERSTTQDLQQQLDRYREQFGEL